MTAAAYIILGYLILLTGIGIWHSRHVRSGEDFALAGRRLGVTVTAGTLVATWMGTGSLFGSPQFTIEHGIAALFLPLGGVLGILVLGMICSRAREIPAMSVPEILRIRFGRVAQIIAALALIAAYLIIASYQYRAGAYVAKQLFPGAPTFLLPIAFAVFIILYTVLAGMISVAWTDLVNGILMAAGLLAVLVWVLVKWNPTTYPIPDEMADLSGGLSPVRWIGYLLPAFLLVMGDANLYQRFMSTSSPRTARRSAFWMFWGVLVLEYTIIITALLGWLLLPEKPDNPAHTLVNLASTIVPSGLGLLVLATSAAVIITTADSILLGASTSVSVDLVGGLTTPWKQRLIVVVLGVVSLGLAYASDKFFEVALYAYTLYGVTLTPALICALVFPRVPRSGIVGGMTAGLATAVIWKVLVWRDALPPVLADWEPVLPALAANLLVILVLSAPRRAGPPTGDVAAVPAPDRRGT